MTSIGGSARIRIEPDLTGFSAAVESTLASMNTQVELDVDDTALESSIDEAVSGMDIELEADVDTSGITDGIDDAAGEIDPIDVEADLDTAGIEAAVGDIESLDATVQVDAEIDTASVVADWDQAVAQMEERGKGVALGISAGIGAAFAGGVMAADTFDQAIATIRVGTGATGAELEALGDIVDNIANDTPAGFDDIAIAVADLNTRLGLTGPELEALSEQMLDVSRITGTDLATNIRGSARLFQSWGVDVDDQSAVLDRLFVTSQTTGAGFDTLAQQAVQFGAPMRALGFELDQSIALFGALEAGGVNAESTMSGLRRALASLAKEGVEDTSEALTIAIERIESAGSVAEANEVALELFGTRAGPELARAIQEGALGVDELMSALDGSDETIAAAADDARTFGDELRVLGNRVITAARPIGDALIPVVEQVGDLLVSGLELFTDLPEPVQNTIIVVAGLAAAALPLITALGALKIALPLVAGGLALLTSPITLAIGGVAALTGGIIWLWRNSETFRGIITGVGDAISSVFVAALELAGAAVQAFTAPFVALFEQAFATVQQIIDVFVKLFTGDFEGAFDSVVEMLEGMISFILQALTLLPRQALNALKAFAPNLYESGRSALAGLLRSVQSGLEAVLNRMRRFPGQALRFFRDLPRNMLNLGKEILGGLLDGIMAGWEKVRAFVAGIADKIKSLKGPIEVDRQLLVPEGNAIMAGLREGLERGWAPIAGWINKRGGFFKGLFTGAQVDDIGEITVDAMLGNLEDPAGKLETVIPPVPRFWTSFEDMLQQAKLIASMFNVMITSTLRDPIRNAQVGGAPGSLHLTGRAVDFAGPYPNMNNLAVWARNFTAIFQEILWLVAGHFDHVHLGWRSLPRRQHGGGVRGGEPYLVGEAGAEIFFPTQSGFVMSNDDAKAIAEFARAASQQGSVSEPITVISNNADPEVVAGLVQAQLRGPMSTLGRR